MIPLIRGSAFSGVMQNWRITRMTPDKSEAEKAQRRARWLSSGIGVPCKPSQVWLSPRIRNRGRGSSDLLNTHSLHDPSRGLRLHRHGLEELRTKRTRMQNAAIPRKCERYARKREDPSGDLSQRVFLFVEP